MEDEWEVVLKFKSGDCPKRHPIVGGDYETVVCDIAKDRRGNALLCIEKNCLQRVPYLPIRERDGPD